MTNVAILTRAGDSAATFNGKSDGVSVKHCPARVEIFEHQEIKSCEADVELSQKDDCPYFDLDRPVVCDSHIVSSPYFCNKYSRSLSGESKPPWCKLLEVIDRMDGTEPESVTR